MVEQFAHQEAEKHGNRGCNGNGQQKAANPHKAPVSSQENGYLGRHGSDYNTKVQSHACQDRYDQGQHQEGVTRNTRKQLRYDKGKGLFGSDCPAHTQDDEQYDNFILK